MTEYTQQRKIHQKLNKIVKSKLTKLLMIFALVMSVVTLGIPPAHAYAGGQGTVSNPYLVSTPADLNQMRNNPLDHFKLTNDIDMTGMSWTPITEFSGSLDGQGFKIIGITASGNVANFGFIGKTAGKSASRVTIKNVNFTNIKITNGAKDYTGLVTGYAIYTDLINVSASGESSSQGDYIGGLVGMLNTGSTITNSYSTGKVSGVNYVGGLVGKMTNANVSITKSFSTANTTGTGTHVGGIAGIVTKEVADVYSTGNVKGTNYVGGIAGTNTNASGSTIKNVYATGSVEGTDRTGGIIGSHQYGSLSNAYALNKNIKGSSPSVTGKAIGQVTNGTTNNIISMVGMNGNGHSQNITGDLYPQDLMKQTTYQSGGFEFGAFNTAVWGIDEGSTLPYLVSNIQKNQYNAETVEWYDPITQAQPPAKPTLSASTSAPTKNPVLVTANFPSEATVKEYKIGNGSWINYTAPVSISDNTTVYARGAAGAVYSEVAELAITNIDKVAPVKATLTPSTTSPTNKNVTVTITYPVDGAVKEYKLNSEGTWKTYSSPITLTQNDIVYARSTDLAGNLSAEASLDVNNIKKVTIPVPTFTPSVTDNTNQNVVITINYPAEGTIKEYRVDGGSWTTYSTSISFAQNGRLEVRASDAYGNVSAIGTYDVSNIDKTVPAAATLTPSTTAPTNQNVLVTIDYPAGVAVKQYKIGQSGSWTNYTAPVSMSDNETIYARSTSSAGTHSPESSLDVSNIDKVTPVAATFTPSNDQPTNKDIIVGITYPNDAVTKEYRVDSGAWEDYTTGIIFSKNGKVEARSADSAGNVSVVSSYDVTNIVKATVSISLSEWSTISKTQNILVSVNGITPILTKYTKGSKDASFFNSEGTEFTGSSFTVSEKGVYTVYAVDAHGNNGVKEIDVKNIDSDAPVISFTNTVEGKVYGDSVTPTITVTDANSPTYTATLNGAPYNGGAITESGKYTLTINAKDAADNTASKSISFEINKAPVKVGFIPKQTLTEAQVEEIDLIAYFNDPEGDALTYTAASNNPDIVAATTLDSKVKITGLKVGTGTVSVTVRDAHAETDAQTFQVEVTASGITLTLLDEGVRLIDSTTDLDLVGTVNSPGKKSIEVVTSVNSVENKVSLVATGSDDNWNTQYQSSTIPVGAYLLGLYAEDSAKVKEAYGGNTVVLKVPYTVADYKPLMEQYAEDLSKTTNDMTVEEHQKLLGAYTIMKTLDTQNTSANRVTARDKVNKLVNGVVKTEYLKLLGEKALDGMIKTPTDITDEDFKDAGIQNTKPELLPAYKDALDKYKGDKAPDDMTKEDIQKVVDAVNAVNDAQDSKTLEDINKGYEAVDKLKDGTLKDELKGILDGLKNDNFLNNPGNATADDLINNGIQNVNPDLEEEYQDALSGYTKPVTIQDIQDIVDMVNQADRTRLDLTDQDLIKLENMVLALKTSATKDKYIIVHRAYNSMRNFELDMIDAKFTLMESNVSAVTAVTKPYMGKMVTAFDKVKVAANNRSNLNIESAQASVDQLDAGLLKSRLIQTLVALKAVEDAKDNPTNETIQNGRGEVAKLPDSSLKDQLEKELDDLANSIKPAAMGEVHAIFVDESDNELAPPVVIKGEVGKPYTTNAQVIEDYTLFRVVGNEDSLITEGVTTIKYIYKKVTKPDPIVYGEVHISYLDEDGVEIKPQKIIRNRVGSSYSTEAPYIYGYKQKTVNGNETGEIIEGITTVVYRYEKDIPPVAETGEVHVKYLDDGGSELRPAKVLKGNVDSVYSTEAPHIDGYTFSLVVGDEVGKITNIVTNVTYIYKKDPTPPAIVMGEVHITYLDENMAEIKEKKIIRDEEGKPYWTEAPVISGYEYVSSVGAESGTISYAQTNVVYFYKAKVPTAIGAVIVKYVDDAGLEIKTAKTLKGEVGSIYSTEAPHILGYTLKDITGDEIGKITNDVTEVVYTYTKDPVTPEVILGEVHVSYVDETMTEIKEKKVISKAIGETYTTEAPVISGYDFVGVMGNETGLISSAQTNVVYTYKKQITTEGNVQVLYLDENQEQIKPTKILKGKIGTIYIAEAPYITGYALDSISGNEVGKIDETITSIVYHYKQNSDPSAIMHGEVQVSYVDENMEELDEKKVIKAEVGESYMTQPLAIEGYTYTDVIGEEIGVISFAKTNVVYSYGKDTEETDLGEVIISYVDETGNSIKDQKIIKDYVGQPYFTEPPAIKGYKYISVVGEEEGVIIDSPINVTYTYEKELESIALGEVEINYLDKDLRELKPKKVISGELGTRYSTEPPFIKGYNYINVIGNQEGNFSETTVKVVYIYEKNDVPGVDTMGEVHINYVDDKGADLKPTKFIRDKVGTAYTSSALAVDGYELVNITGPQNGKIEGGVIKITYTYKKTKTVIEATTGQVEVRYLDEKGQPIYNTLTLKGAVGTTYKTDSLTIAGYTLLTVVGNPSGKYATTPIIVYYNYKKNDTEATTGEVQVRYVDEANKDLKERLIIKDKIGAPYSTSKLDIEGYSFVSVTGEVVGKIKQGTSYILYAYKKTETPQILPELTGFKTSIMRTHVSTDLYQLDKSGSMVKATEVPATTVLKIYDSYEDYYKVTNGMYIKKDVGTAYVGQGESRGKTINVYDSSGEVVRTMKKDQEYKVYSYNSEKYIIGNGEHVKAKDFNAYIFGWIEIKKDVTLYDKNGKVSRILKANETYRVFAVDKESLNLGGGYTVKRKDDSYKFISR